MLGARCTRRGDKYAQRRPSRDASGNPRRIAGGAWTRRRRRRARPVVSVHLILLPVPVSAPSSDERNAEGHHTAPATFVATRGRAINRHSVERTGTTAGLWIWVGCTRMHAGGMEMSDADVLATALLDSVMELRATIASAVRHPGPHSES